MAYLVVEGPDGQLIRVPLGNQALTIGRDPGCDLTLEDRLVSRQHVSISPGFIVQDLDSFNGVYVRGKRIQRAFLVPGESFRIGAKGKFEVRITSDRPIGLDETAPDAGLQTIADSSMIDDQPRLRSNPACSISPDFEGRLDTMRRETERLARENEELRRRLEGGNASSHPGPGATIEPTPRDPGASAEAAAASSDTMHFQRSQSQRYGTRGEPREES